MFVGREKELDYLERMYQKKGGQMIVVYGRRRIGKTETLRQFCMNKPHVFFSCQECTDQIQLRNFSAEFLKEDIPAKKYISEFRDWTEAFRSILELPYGDNKRMLIIDEFPYMCRGNSAIPSILQNLWDHELKNQNIMIILCGSAMSFIEKQLLAEKNPLYGRATGIYKMTEMDFYDAVKFFPDYSAQDKIKAFSVLGGVPHYLKEFDPKKSVDDNIKENILSKGCILYSEVNFLMHQELREATQYNSIIEAVALGNAKLNEITQKAMVESTPKTSVYLKNLVELGIVQREFSVDTKTKEKSNSRRGEYLLTDDFFRFWYAFSFANNSALEAGDVEGVFRYVITPRLHEFTAHCFEKICRQYVQHLQMQGKLPFRYERMGRWFGKTTVRDKQDLRVAETEIDLVGISDTEKKYLVGECKYKNSPFSYAEYLNTFAKLTPQKEQSEFYYMLFSENGFDETLLAESKITDKLILCGLDQIVHGTI